MPLNKSELGRQGRSRRRRRALARGASEPLAGSILHLLGYTSMEAKSGAGVDVGRRLGASRRAGGGGQGPSRQARAGFAREPLRPAVGLCHNGKRKASGRRAPMWSSDHWFNACARTKSRAGIGARVESAESPRLVFSLRCLCSRRCAPLGLSSLSFPLTLFVRTGLRGN